MKALKSHAHALTVFNLLSRCWRSVADFWARRNLTPQERANLRAGYTPPAVISASLGGGTHF
ncbi:hypothetical protein RE9431_48920 (plasmid) [Prescottella equi]|uniref:Uncharacterized protein n=1 Tax=Rhodococcus hoagii TaxID=43767 RepID=A0A0F6WFU2_RHOHA|nr:hypothetical protein pVAPN2012_0870 [Prescottella equi]AKG90539.1 hypothetical protein pVAPN_0870 [Prescottella equi]BCN46635.1 hypothetical protein RE9414_49150 [Prescottella equi]BCN56564.1 hypothetical protein RE9425_49540 [Prescottella equi]BCN66437.1 hypothetical protein RE9431_48920 [Prescottella equi]